MKRKIIALLLCIVCVVSLCFPVAADDDGYSAIVSDIDKTCPTCGATLHASWGSTSGAEVELEISDTGKVKIPAGAGAFARIHLRCSSCGYEKTETRLLGLDFGAEKPGKPVQALSGIGRKDLPGYADDNGTPSVGLSGQLQLTLEPLYVRFNSVFSIFSINFAPSVADEPTSAKWSNHISYSGSSADSSYFSVLYQFNAPAEGLYYIGSDVTEQKYVSTSFFNGKEWRTSYLKFSSTAKYYKSISVKKGSVVSVILGGNCFLVQRPFKYTCYPITICYEPLGDSSVTTVNNITINNNTWNGNIYVDNSTNLTYIYPQYTTVNEKNETITNISNTPIIYNNETKQYYTYDQTTKNYYYITYNSDPAPSPTPTPAPTDKPGGSISTPETGKPGNSSGSSWWDKLLSKIGDAIIDGLLGAVSAVLKLIFKLLSTILSWIIWAVSRVFDLLPFLPPGLGGLLVGGVVVCFVIGIIKFIRG